ncbi:MAG: formamidopyrimidine-DNA glycosylase, partial [Deltaproteobacteria bacterium]|nr:formamidopyrimidine-DNA glycosylase [Deltaproteobacteria bacterium]
MPELPEVEATRRRLDAWLAGQPIVAVHVADASSVRTGLTSRPSDAVSDPAAATRPWIGTVAGTPLRRGKRLGLRIGSSGLLAHLGMSGKWIRRAPGDPVPKFGRIGLEVPGRVAWFVDPRRFGCVTVCPAEAIDGALATGLGPDALLELPDGPGLAARFAVKRPIKIALLEQDRLAGLGNIHAVEALWRARIHPDRRCDALTAAEWAALSSAIGAQMTFAIADLGEDD